MPGVTEAQVTRRFGAADFLTALRLPLALAFPLVGDLRWRLGIVAIASVTDYLDGYVARHHGGSRAGALLDPVADKVFMLSTFGTLAVERLLAPLDLALVLLRDIVAGIAFVGTALLRRPVALPARPGGKAVTVVQLVTLAACLLESPLTRPLAWATGAIAVYALWDYGRAA